MRWTRPVAAVGAVALAEQWIVAWGPDATLYVLDRASGAEHARHRGLSGIAGVEVAYTGERVVAHDGRDLVAVHADGTIAGEAVCDARGIAAAATSSSETFVVCTGGELGRVGTGGYMALRPTPFGVALAPATALALSETGMELAIGSATGDVQVHDMRGCFSEGCKPVAPSMLARVLPTAIRKLACLGNDVIAIGDRGDAAHIGRGSIGELTRLPIAADRPIVFLEGGEIVVGGKAHHAWSIDDTARPSTLQAPRGVVAAAVSPSRVVGLTGGGEVLTWDARRGDRSRLLDGAVAIAIDPTGERIAAATASAMHVYAATGEVVARIEEPGVRRVAFLGGEWIAIGDSWLRRGAGARLPIPTVRASTISGAAWIVDPDLAVWRILETAERVGTAVGAVAIAAARDNHRLFATATTHRVRLGDWELAVDDGEVTGLALDAAGARLAIASSRGVIEVWSTGERRLLARATNLDQRARWLEVRDDELWAAGDDGAIRRWDLRAVTRPLPELEQMALATWGPP